MITARRIFLILSITFFTFTKNTHAEFPTPPISIDLSLGFKKYDEFKSYLAEGHLRSVSIGDIKTPDNSPEHGKLADIYHGMVKSNGDVISWLPKIDSASKFSDAAAVANGLIPIKTNTKLEGIIGTSYWGGNDWLNLAYEFTNEDVTGLYTLFVLVVEAGKEPSDPTNWITSKTRIVSVKNQLIRKNP